MKIMWKMRKRCYGKLLFDLRNSAPLEALLVLRQTETSVILQWYSLFFILFLNIRIVHIRQLRLLNFA